MKPIEDSRKSKYIDELLDNIESNIYDMSIGDITVEIPKKYLYEIKEKQQLLEAENVKDIHDNYENITKLIKPLSQDKIKKFNKEFKKNIENAILKSINDNGEEITKKNLTHLIESQIEYAKEHRIANDYVNNSTIILDNIYVGDFSHKKQEYIQSIHMLVKDKYGNKILGACYFGIEGLERKNILQEQIEQAMRYKEYSTTFDIVFQAIPRIEGEINGRIIPNKFAHPKKISITSIVKSDGENEYVSPVNEDIFEPVKK